MAKFLLCEHCKNLVGVIHDSGVPIICCGQNMTEIIPNSTDASKEKHVPVVKVEGNIVEVIVGDVQHPMTDKHFIDWIYLETIHGGQRKKCIDEPTTTFMLNGDEPVAVYAYCNLHGLFVKKI